jgi:hypothetical protein
VLTTDAKERKDTPIARGVLDYFPDAIAEVARVSRVANEQHNPGEPMHWAKEKSTDEADSLVRHLLERGTFDTDGLRHSAKVAWRGLALLQRELDAEKDNVDEVPLVADGPSFIASLDEVDGRGYAVQGMTVDTFHDDGLEPPMPVTALYEVGIDTMAKAVPPPPADPSYVQDGTVYTAPLRYHGNTVMTHGYAARVPHFHDEETGIYTQVEV